MRLLNEIASERDPERPIVRRLEDGTKVPGFGCSYYATGDPRALFLMNRYEDMFGDEKEFRRLKRAIAAVKETLRSRAGFRIRKCLRTFAART